MILYPGPRQPANDLSFDGEVERRPLVTSIAISPSPPVHLRRSQPDETLRPSTAHWLASLPSAARPLALPALFTRIANRLAACWGNPLALEPYLAQLLTAEPHRRRGFPPEVRRELQIIHALHVAQAMDLASRGVDAGDSAEPALTTEKR
ncbi:MAG: hypothetical protein ABJC33_12760 [Betaproteobacteria bacterium]